MPAKNERTRDPAEPEEHPAVTPTGTLEVCPVPINNDVYQPNCDLLSDKEDEQDSGRNTSTPNRDRDSEEAPSVAQDPYIDPDDFPDGGIKAYTVLLGAWCTLFCTFGIGNSVGVFQAYFTREGLSDYSSSTVAWVTGLMLWTINFMPVVVSS